MTISRNPFILVSFALGFVPFLGAVTPSFAQTTASDVVDRPTLKAFVERAAALTESRVSNADDAYDFFDSTFRPTGEWNMGSIYIYVFNAQAVMRFHGANQSLEGTSLYDNKDTNGVYYMRELIAAAEAGGDFVEYLFDNPDVVGDEEEGSPKVGYGELLNLSGGRLIIGSGYYPAVPRPSPRRWRCLRWQPCSQAARTAAGGSGSRRARPGRRGRHARHAARTADQGSRLRLARGRPFSVYGLSSGRAKTNRLLPTLGRSSGVSSMWPLTVDAVPVLIATYCRPSTA